MSPISTVKILITRQRPFLTLLEKKFNFKNQSSFLDRKSLISFYLNRSLTTSSPLLLNFSYLSSNCTLLSKLQQGNNNAHCNTQNSPSTIIGCLYRPSIRQYCQSKPGDGTPLNDHEKNCITHDVEPQNLGLVGRFKLMYTKYWYVLVPVHLITSTGWICGFYYLSSSGVDIPALLDMLHVSETVTEKLENSSMGHLAIAYLCYKLATPIRYMITLGGTTITIKYLSQWGYIKPVPSKEQFRKMYADRKEQIKRGYEEFQEKRQEITRRTSKHLK